MPEHTFTYDNPFLDEPTPPDPTPVEVDWSTILAGANEAPIYQPPPRRRVSIDLRRNERRERTADPMTVPEENVITPSFCDCEMCKIKKGEPSKLKRATVHQYHYKPQWKTRSVTNDPFSYFLGVELETDNYFQRGVARTNIYGDVYRDQVRSMISNNIAADMRRPKTLWVAKRDGSVDGPEFASHPATLTYWRKHEGDLSEMFKMLLHAGYRSHDNDKCGMHINISRTAMADTEHLYRFLTLLHFSPAWSIRMAQRTRESANSWAGLNLVDKDARHQVARTAFQTSGWRAGEATSKYTALNIPAAREGRFEFRLPRGTLRLDRFFKNLEWTVAMIEFTRNHTVAASRPKHFMEWVMANQGDYPFLAGFLAEREPKLTALVGE